MSPVGSESDSVGAAKLSALPFVSVIMAVYNGERYVATAVESVLRQTHQDFEFVVVDDRSTDRTREILQKYAEQDPRMKVVVQEQNVDQPASLNRALAIARNEWVAVLDADDAFMPHRLETQLRALRGEPSVRVLGAHAIRIDRWGNEQGLKAVGPRSVAEFKRTVERDGLLTIVHPSALMHRPTILAVGGYDPNFGAAADTELWSRVSDKHVVMSLTEPLLYYRVHPGSMTTNRFFEQQLMVRWIAERQRTRRRGLAQPTLEEFQRLQGKRSSPRRLNLVRQDRGRYLLMRSGFAWREGHKLRALLLRTIALALVPFEVLGRAQSWVP